MPRTPEAQKAYNDKRRATIKEAKALQKSGGVLEPHHIAALKTEDTRQANQKKQYLATRTALVKGDATVSAPTGLKKRVEQKNPFAVGRLKAEPEVAKPAEQSMPKVSNVLDYEKSRKTGTTNPINNDLSHFSSMYDLADKLDEKLLDSKLSSKNRNVKAASGHLATFFEAHDSGLDAHLKGDAKAAAANMESMHKSLTAAHIALDSFKQLKLNPKISEISQSIKNSYVSSSTPGIGNKPHESFVPTTKPTFKPSTVLDKPKNTGSLPKSTGLADSFDALPADPSFGSSLGRQFTGQEHMNSAVIGMMEGRG
jgi:dsDNA-binding SOS-regulon protein